MLNEKIMERMSVFKLYILSYFIAIFYHCTRYTTFPSFAQEDILIKKINKYLSSITRVYISRRMKYFFAFVQCYHLLVT